MPRLPPRRGARTARRGTVRLDTLPALLLSPSPPSCWNGTPASRRCPSAARPRRRRHPVDESDGLLVVPIESETPSTSRRSWHARQAGREGAFDDDDRLLAATLAAELGASLHNATVYQREHESPRRSSRPC